MSRPIHVMFDAAEKQGVVWDDEDMLCIACSYIDRLIIEGKTTSEHFDEFVKDTALDDALALEEAEE